MMNYDFIDKKKNGWLSIATLNNQKVFHRAHDDKPESLDWFKGKFTGNPWVFTI